MEKNEESSSDNHACGGSKGTDKEKGFVGKFEKYILGPLRRPFMKKKKDTTTNETQTNEVLIQEVEAQQDVEEAIEEDAADAEQANPVNEDLTEDGILPNSLSQISTNDSTVNENQGSSSSDESCDSLSESDATTPSAPPRMLIKKLTTHTMTIKTSKKNQNGQVNQGTVTKSTSDSVKYYIY